MSFRNDIQIILSSILFFSALSKKKELSKRLKERSCHKCHELHFRYSLLNRHLPLTVKNSRGIDWSNDATKLAFLGNTAYNNLCYCDEKCVTFDDCCSDYSFACPRMFLLLLQISK